MPLSHQARLSAFDLDTQILLSTVYVELCAKLTGPLNEQDEVRGRIADEIFRLAFQDERNPSVLKSKTVAALGLA